MENHPGKVGEPAAGNQGWSHSLGIGGKGNRIKIPIPALWGTFWASAQARGVNADDEGGSRVVWSVESYLFSLT